MRKLNTYYTFLKDMPSKTQIIDNTNLIYHKNINHIALGLSNNLLVSTFTHFTIYTIF